MSGSSTKTKRRLSLTAQVNILIVVITLGITLLMVGISAANYRKAILVPGIRKLSGLTVETEEYVPFLNYFLQMFHTDDFQKARASHEAGDPEKDRFLDWMDAAPSFTADDPEYGRESLFFDIIAFDILLRETMEQVDLEIACAEILEDGKIYRAALETNKDEYGDWQANFGREESFYGLNPQDFVKPEMIETEDGKVLLLRCVTFALEKGEARLWLGYNMTQQVKEYRGFVARAVVSVLILTAAASAVSVYLLRRYVTKPITALAQSATEFTPEEDGGGRKLQRGQDQQSRDPCGQRARRPQPGNPQHADEDRGEHRESPDHDGGEGTDQDAAEPGRADPEGHAAQRLPALSGENGICALRVHDTGPGCGRRLL